jgi:hypothetical protein
MLTASRPWISRRQKGQVLLSERWGRRGGTVTISFVPTSLGTTWRTSTSTLNKVMEGGMMERGTTHGR